MKEPNKPQPRTPEQLSTLERVFFVMGAGVGFLNSSVISAHGAPLGLYFVSVLPILPVTFLFAYQLASKKMRPALSITAMNGGGYLVGETLERLAHNYL